MFSGPKVRLRRRSAYHIDMKFSDFDAILFDMDGTLYHADHALPGAAETLAHLKAMGKPTGCVSNAAWRTADQLHERLTRMGIDMPADRIHTAGAAMADWIAGRWAKPRVCAFAGAAFERMLGERATLVRRQDEPCDVVALAGFLHADDVPFDKALAATALWHLRAGAMLAVSCRDRVYPTADGVAIGSGSWAAMFIHAAELPPERVHYAGKPDAEFFRSFCKKINVRPERCLLVGDNLESDIRGGMNAGMSTAIVMSGVTDHTRLLTSSLKPDGVFEDLAHLLIAMR